MSQDEISVLYFRTQGGPNFKLNSVSRYSVTKLSNVIPVDGLEKLCRIDVINDSMRPKEENEKEFWYHYLLDKGTLSRMKAKQIKFKTKFDKIAAFKTIKEKMFAGELLFDKPNIIESLITVETETSRKKKKKDNSTEPQESTPTTIASLTSTESIPTTTTTTLASSATTDSISTSTPPVAPLASTTDSISTSAVTTIAPSATTASSSTPTVTPSTSTAPSSTPISTVIEVVSAVTEDVSNTGEKGTKVTKSKPVEKRGLKRVRLPSTSSSSSSSSRASSTSSLRSASSARALSRKSVSPGRKSQNAPTWYDAPESWLTNAPLWRIIWHFGLEMVVYKPRETMQDYTPKIKSLINSSTHPGRLGVGFYSDDWQIITPDGKTWHEDDLKALIKSNYIKESRIHNKFYCTAPFCEDCEHRPDSNNPKGQQTLLRRLMKKMNAVFYCLSCGDTLSERATLNDHAKSCDFQSRVAKENPLTSKKKTEKTTKKLKAATSQIVPIEDNDFEQNFLDFLGDIFQEAQKNQFLKDKALNDFIDEIKKDCDFNFVSFYKKYHTQTTKFHIEMDDDKFFTITYWSPHMENSDNRKSPMFKIIEIKTAKTISIHRLEAILSDTLDANDDKCHYDGCTCENNFVNSDKDVLAGHILFNNILIMCAACRVGFRDFEDFERHIKPDCWIKRKAFIKRRNARND